MSFLFDAVTTLLSPTTKHSTHTMGTNSNKKLWKDIVVPYSSTMHQQVQEMLEPLWFRKMPLFNFSSLLFLNTEFPDPSSSSSLQLFSMEQFQQMMNYNKLETIVLQLLHVLFVSMDRCRESNSIKAQLATCNGFSLLSLFLINYAKYVLEKKKQKEEFKNEFFQSLTRVVMGSANAKIFDTQIVLQSNQLLCYLIKSQFYSVLFLPYFHSVTMEHISIPLHYFSFSFFSQTEPVSWLQYFFVECLHRLVQYNQFTSLRFECMYCVLTLLWQFSMFSTTQLENHFLLFTQSLQWNKMICNSNSEEVIQESNMTKLLMKYCLSVRQLVELGKEHLRLSLSLLNFWILNNSNCREVIIRNHCLEWFWNSILSFSFCSQYLNQLEMIESNQEEAKLTVQITTLICKLLYICFLNEQFQQKMLNQFIVKQILPNQTSATHVFVKGMKHLILGEEIESNQEKEEETNFSAIQKVQTGQIFNFTSWLLHMLQHTIKTRFGEENDKEAVKCMIHSELTLLLLRILKIVIEKRTGFVKQTLEWLPTTAVELIRTLMIVLQAAKDDAITKFSSNKSQLIRLLDQFREYICTILFILTCFIDEQEYGLLLSDQMAINVHFELIQYRHTLEQTHTVWKELNNKLLMQVDSYSNIQQTVQQATKATDYQKQYEQIDTQMMNNLMFLIRYIDYFVPIKLT